MGDVYCNNCGHQNPIGSNFCSSCGAILETQSPENTTITFHPATPADPVDPAESPPATDPPDGDIEVEVGDLPSDLGVLVVKRGQNAGSRFTLTQPVTTAGRHPQSDIFAPVAGTIVAVNDDLAESPEQLNDDPYGAGWICVIQPDDAAAVESLLDAAAYISLIDG